jgi:hypothetical protein
MLVPVLVRANYKIAAVLNLTLENLVAGNLPLLFPEVYIFNRTPDPNNLTVAGVRVHSYLNQADPDFTGLVNQPLFSSFSIGNGQNVKLPGLDNSLVPTNYGISTQLTLTNAGPAAGSWVSLVIKGMIESSVRPDPAVVVNVV